MVPFMSWAWILKLRCTMRVCDIWPFNPPWVGGNAGG
jgi:hypothetical protein